MYYAIIHEYHRDVGYQRFACSPYIEFSAKEYNHRRNDRTEVQFSKRKVTIAVNSY